MTARAFFGGGGKKKYQYCSGSTSSSDEMSLSVPMSVVVLGQKGTCESSLQTIRSVSGDRRPQHFLGTATRETEMKQVCSRAHSSFPVASAV